MTVPFSLWLFTNCCLSSSTMGIMIRCQPIPCLIIQCLLYCVCGRHNSIIPGLSHLWCLVDFLWDPQPSSVACLDGEKIVAWLQIFAHSSVVISYITCGGVWMCDTGMVLIVRQNCSLLMELTSQHAFSVSHMNLVQAFLVCGLSPACFVMPSKPQSAPSLMLEERE